LVHNNSISGKFWCKPKQILINRNWIDFEIEIILKTNLLIIIYIYNEHSHQRIKEKGKGKTKSVRNAEWFLALALRSEVSQCILQQKSKLKFGTLQTHNSHDWFGWKRGNAFVRYSAFHPVSDAITHRSSFHQAMTKKSLWKYQ
jgi:hypothetical protein